MDLSVKRDGLVLRGRLDKSTEGKSPVVIFFHGFGCNIDANPGSSYQKITEFLLKQKISVIRFDFNGHGTSDGCFNQMNIWNEIEDAVAILEYVRKLDWVENIYLMGHSQGGVIAGMMAGYYPDVVSRLVMLAPAVSLKTDAQKGVCMQAVYDTNHIPEGVNVDGIHEVGGHYFRIAKSLPIFEITSQFDKPALLLIGSEDNVVSTKEAKQYADHMKNCDFWALKELDHGLSGSDQYTMLSAISTFLK